MAEEKGKKGCFSKTGCGCLTVFMILCAFYFVYSLRVPGNGFGSFIGA